jgi:hypothetical protein
MNAGKHWTQASFASQVRQWRLQRGGGKGLKRKGSRPQSYRYRVNIDINGLSRQIYSDQASSRGLVVKAEDSWLKGCGFKTLTEDTIFQAPLIWMKSLEQ